MNNIYDSKYRRLHNNAILFAAERQEPVELCRARRQANHWQLRFKGQKPTPNYLTYEIAYPDGHVEVVWKSDEADLVTL